MKTIRKFPTFSLLAVISALVFATASRGAAGDNDQRGVLFGTVSIPAGLSKSEVQNDIVKVLSGREWDIKAKDDASVVGYLKHRSNEATVTLVYDSASVEIYCVGWSIDKHTGERKEPQLPKGWLKYIRADLIRIFNKAAAQR